MLTEYERVTRAPSPGRPHVLLRCLDCWHVQEARAIDVFEDERCDHCHGPSINYRAHPMILESFERSHRAL